MKYMSFENIKFTDEDNDKEERKKVEKRFKPIKITEEDRKKAQEKLDQMAAEGREINY